jgi:hypothetical protein
MKQAAGREFFENLVMNSFARVRSKMCAKTGRPEETKRVADYVVVEN